MSGNGRKILRMILRLITGIVWVRKEKRRNEYEKRIRSTYLTDGDGVTAWAFGGVKAAENAAQMLREPD